MTDSLAKFQTVAPRALPVRLRRPGLRHLPIMNYKRREVERFISDDLPHRSSRRSWNTARWRSSRRPRRNCTESPRRSRRRSARMPSTPTATWPKLTTARRSARSTWNCKAKSRRRARPRRARSPDLQPPVRLLQPLLPGRRLHLQAPLLQAQNATPSPTTARRSRSTGPTTTSTTSRPPSTSPTTPSPRPTA